MADHSLNNNQRGPAPSLASFKHRMGHIAILLAAAFAGFIGAARAADVSTHVLGASKRTLDPANDTVNTGYYAATTLSAVDTDLAPCNIERGVTIFGKVGALAFPDTGQTTSYTADDDASYNPSAAQQSYTDNGNGAITDNRTGLMWKKCSEPDTTTGCGGTHSTYTWVNAISQCEGLTYPPGGHTDWRLPNAIELFSIVKQEGAAPYINATYFPSTESDYWTSTLYSTITNALAGHFTKGTMSNGGPKTTGLYVRCVRGGQ